MFHVSLTPGSGKRVLINDKMALEHLRKTLPRISKEVLDASMESRLRSYSEWQKGRKDVVDYLANENPELLRLIETYVQSAKDNGANSYPVSSVACDILRIIEDQLAVNDLEEI